MINILNNAHNPYTKLLSELFELGGFERTQNGPINSINNRIEDNILSKRPPSVTYYHKDKNILVEFYSWYSEENMEFRFCHSWRLFHNNSEVPLAENNTQQKRDMWEYLSKVFEIKKDLD